MIRGMTRILLPGIVIIFLFPKVTKDKNKRRQKMFSRESAREVMMLRKVYLVFKPVVKMVLKHMIRGSSLYLDYYFVFQIPFQEDRE